jgi:hypothetical protein
MNKAVCVSCPYGEVSLLRSCAKELTKSIGKLFVLLRSHVVGSLKYFLRLQVEATIVVNLWIHFSSAYTTRVSFIPIPECSFRLKLLFALLDLLPCAKDQETDQKLTLYRENVSSSRISHTISSLPKENRQPLPRPSAERRPRKVLEQIERRMVS